MDALVEPTVIRSVLDIEYMFCVKASTLLILLHDHWQQRDIMHATYFPIG